MLATAVERLGRVDVWINNAGQGISRQPTELTDEDIDEMMLINVKSVLYGMQAVLPHLCARGNGHIINVSSLLGRVPFARFRAAYCAAKHAMNSLTASFRMEIGAKHPDADSAHRDRQDRRIVIARGSAIVITGRRRGFGLRRPSIRLLLRWRGRARRRAAEGRRAPAAGKATSCSPRPRREPPP